MKKRKTFCEKQVEEKLKKIMYQTDRILKRYFEIAKGHY